MSKRPQDTSAEEPDGGNPHIRFRGGPRQGDRPGLLNKSSIIIATVGLAIGFLGCASQYKQEAKQEQQAKTMPVNCATAQGDIAMLQKEKVSAAQQAAAGVSTIAPVGAVAGFLTGTEGEKAQVTTGEYNKALDQAIARIKSTCGIT